MNLMTPILILRTLLEFLQGVGRNEPRLGEKILVFQGSLKLEVFGDWLSTVERVFDYYEIMGEKKVKLVAIRLKGRAYTWWEKIANFSPLKW